MSPRSLDLIMTPSINKVSKTIKKTSISKRRSKTRVTRSSPKKLLASVPNQIKDLAKVYWCPKGKTNCGYWTYSRSAFNNHVANCDSINEDKIQVTAPKVFNCDKCGFWCHNMSGLYNHWCSGKINRIMKDSFITPSMDASTINTPEALRLSTEVHHCQECKFWSYTAAGLRNHKCSMSDAASNSSSASKASASSSVSSSSKKSQVVGPRRKQLLRMFDQQNQRISGVLVCKGCGYWTYSRSALSVHQQLNFGCQF